MIMQVLASTNSLFAGWRKREKKGNTKNERERQRKKERQKKRDREPYMQLTACFSFIHDKGPSKEKKIVRPRSHKS